MNKFILRKPHTPSQTASADPADLMVELAIDSALLHDACEEFMTTFREYEGCEALLDNIAELRSMLNANIPFDTITKIYDLQKGLEITLEEFQSLDAKKVEAALESNEKNIWQKIVEFIKNVFTRIKVVVMRFFDVGDKLAKKLSDIVDDIKRNKLSISVSNDAKSLVPYKDFKETSASSTWARDSAFMSLVIGTIGVVKSKAKDLNTDLKFYDGMTKYVGSFCSVMNKIRKDTASWDPETGEFEFDSSKLLDVKQFENIKAAGYDVDHPDKLAEQLLEVLSTYAAWTLSLRKNIENSEINGWPNWIEKTIASTMDKAVGENGKDSTKNLIQCANRILSKTKSEMVKVENRLIKTMGALVSSIKVESK